MTREADGLCGTTPPKMDVCDANFDLLFEEMDRFSSDEDELGATQPYSQGVPGSEFVFEEKLLKSEFKKGTWPSLCCICSHNVGKSCKYDNNDNNNIINNNNNNK